MRAVLFLMLAAGSAAAAPVATLREDVDGDGTADSVELAADGSLAVGAVKLKVAPAAAKARILVAKLAAGAQLVVDVTHGATREGVVLDRKGGWHVVARFPLGGVGLDREYGIEVDATPAGIYRYQTSGRVQRCDDHPAYLFGEKLDGAAFKKLDRLPSGVAVGASTLTARLDTTPAPPPLVFQAKGASHQAGVGDAGGLAIPRELDDGRNDTQWREDIASSGGEGQFFSFRARVEQQKAQQLRIVPGDPTSAVRSKQAGRPRVMAIVSKQGAWRFDLPANSQGEPLGAAYVVDLPATVGDCVTVVIESVSGPGPTAIAELGLYAEGERSGGGEAVLARVIALGKGGESGAAQTLAKRGAAGAAAIDGELAKTTDAGVRRRLIHALVRIVDPAATASLVRAATEGWVRDKDLIDVIGALAANGQITALRDLAAKGGLPVAIRVAAAGKLVPSGNGFVALVELAGKGPRELRRAVIERLASAPIDQLLQAAPAAADAAASGDLWRAATRASRSQAAARPAVVAAMLAALPAISDYERRYRLIDGIAAHGDAAALAALADALRGLPADPLGSALRQVAVRGIASSPRTEAAPIVINFTRDTDPGVRLAALAALADSSSTTGGSWHGPGGPDEIDRVIINAMVDRWPEVRRRAATALGSRCQRPGPAKVLFETVSKDKDLDVRGDSMLSLVSCKATGVDGLLPFVWNSEKHPLPLRERAIGLVVPLGDIKLATTLVGQFRRWRGQAIESREAIVLAQATAATLGLMKPPGAADALIEALDDVAFPELVGAAALALGELGAQCPARARAKLAALAKSEDQGAVAAKRALGRCTGR